MARMDSRGRLRIVMLVMGTLLDAKGVLVTPWEDRMEDGGDAHDRMAVDERPPRPRGHGGRARLHDVEDRDVFLLDVREGDRFRKPEAGQIAQSEAWPTSQSGQSRRTASLAARASRAKVRISGASATQPSSGSWATRSSSSSPWSSSGSSQRSASSVSSLRRPGRLAHFERPPGGQRKRGRLDVRWQIDAAAVLAEGRQVRDRVLPSSSQARRWSSDQPVSASSP